MMNKQHKHTIPSEKDFNAIACNLPKHLKFKIDDVKQQHDDILIIVNGFEDRSNALINQISKTSYKAKQVLIGKYETNKSDNENKLPELIEGIKKITNNNHVELKADDPLLINSVLSKHIENIKNEIICISIDISVASDRFILSAIHTLLDSTKQIKLRIIYFEARDYHPSHKEYLNDKKNSVSTILNSDTTHEHGIGKIFPSPIHPAYKSENSYSNYLIAIPTLKLSRMLAMLDDYDSSFFSDRSRDSIFWILGKPEQKHSWREELQKEVLQLGLQKQQTNDKLMDGDNTVSCSTLNYLDIMQTIVEKIDNNPRKKFTIIPMGSKMQMVGVGLALFLRSECSVLFASPKKFNAQSYSDGIGQGWSIRFENTNSLKENLKKIGCFNIQPLENPCEDNLIRT